MANIQKLLPRYSAILDGKQKPRFKESKKVLEEKIAQAFAMLEDCTLCERTCGVDRTKGKVGYCKSEGELSVSAHYVGDADLSMFTPSYDVFFLGCTLKCVFCQNPETSQVEEDKKEITEKGLAKLINQRLTPKIIDFVGGDPLPQLPFVLKVLQEVRKNLPVMWNSSFYMTPEAMNILAGVVDVYCPDFKYGNDECAKRLSDVKNYTGIVKRNIQLAAVDSELIIRHLVMPNHVECCSKPVIDFVYRNFKGKVPLELMSQYTPYWKAKDYPDINRKLRKKEFEEVADYARSKNLTCYESIVKNMDEICKDYIVLG
ncbi:radical SAM protein [Candidatus Woesearchaeota archaeon]|nr:radical SAM protein [Candidatus Woesearchaeota archaeon]